MSDPTALVADLRDVAQGWRDAAEDEALARGEGTEDQGGMEYQAALADRAAALIAQQAATIEAKERARTPQEVRELFDGMLADFGREQVRRKAAEARVAAAEAAVKREAEERFSATERCLRLSAALTAAEAERDRLREALSFYGVRESYVARSGMDSPISRDHFGDRARAALSTAKERGDG